ncbi:MAG TPA: histidine kinase dimerization/phospho-acceptor domain-containing protein, partial [Candidatus Polarisedimenticolia bacterium]|nr:histidine kinase dimerization/phospho-acceptor domain-containing protein [Candidatus Polarisedimenticolia bacterium]
MRLAVAALAAAAVTIAALLCVDRSSRREERAERLIANLARVLANPDEQARCTAGPATWRPPRAPHIGAVRITEFSDEQGHHVHVSANGPGPRAFPPPPPPLPGLDPQLEPIEVVVRDSDLRPARPGAPALDDPIVRALAVGDAVSLPGRWWSDTVEVVLRRARDGRCAYVHARGHLRIFAPRTRDSLPWLLPLAGVLCAVLVTMTPVVRRIRRLTDAVAGSAATGFVAAIPIEGSDEVAGLARSFAEASRAVRTQLSETAQREATLRDFLANTTHDVMIPLTVLQAHLAGMQDDEQAGRPRRGEILTSAMDEAHYLGALLQNLAAIAKLDSGGWQPVISEVDMNALMQRVINRHQVIARRLDIAVEFAVPDEPIRAAA